MCIRDSSSSGREEDPLPNRQALPDQDRKDRSVPSAEAVPSSSAHRQGQTRVPLPTKGHPQILHDAQEILRRQLPLTPLIQVRSCSTCKRYCEQHCHNVNTEG